MLERSSKNPGEQTLVVPQKARPGLMEGVRGSRPVTHNRIFKHFLHPRYQDYLAWGAVWSDHGFPGSF